MELKTDDGVLRENNGRERKSCNGMDALPLFLSCQTLGIAKHLTVWHCPPTVVATLTNETSPGSPTYSVAS